VPLEPVSEMAVPVGWSIVLLMICWYRPPIRAMPAVTFW
jgi:hypothetical protein